MSNVSCVYELSILLFSPFFLLTTPASEWLLIIAIPAILTYFIEKTSYILSDGIDVHFVYYINTISWILKKKYLFTWNNSP